LSISAQGSELGPALVQAAKAADWRGVIRILDEHWSTLISDYPAAVRDAVSGLPPQVVAEHPRLVLALEYLQRLSPDRPTTRFRGAALPAPPVGLMDSLAQLTSRAAVARADGRLDEAVAAVIEARAAG
jgi:ATP/maltotriose-dependent transcriptional regulator MalT